MVNLEMANVKIYSLMTMWVFMPIEYPPAKGKGFLTAKDFQFANAKNRISKWIFFAI